MNKKLITIGITLLIVGMIIAPVSAIVTPPTTFKDAFFKGLWTAVLDLQKQITNIQLKPGPPGPTGPPGPAGAQGSQGLAGVNGKDGATVHFGEWQDIVPVNSQVYTEDAADTDGIVTVYCVSIGKPVFIKGMVNPDTVPVHFYSYTPLNPDTNIAETSITMPVRKGEMWNLYWGTSCNFQFELHWLPLSA